MYQVKSKNSQKLKNALKYKLLKFIPKRFSEKKFKSLKN